MNTVGGSPMNRAQHVRGAHLGVRSFRAAVRSERIVFVGAATNT